MFNQKSLENRKKLEDSQRAREAFAICKGLSVALEEAEMFLMKLEEGSKEYEAVSALYDSLNEVFDDSFSVIRKNTTSQLEDFFR